MNDNEYLDEHEDLIPFAEDLKKAWKVYYQKRSGKPYRPSKRYDGMVEWVKMAEAVAPTGATADDWVHAQFKMSKSIPFVNAARGQVALSNYRRFLQLRTMGGWTSKPNDGPQEEQKRSVGELEVMGRILDLKYYLASNCKDDNMFNPDVRKYVLTRLPGFLDALAVILLSPDDEMWDRYGEYVKQEITDTPMLLDAVKKLDMLAAWEYISTHV